MEWNRGLAMTLAGTLMIVLGGCAAGDGLSPEQRCAAAGGQYSAETQSCMRSPASSRSAADTCQARGGRWNATAQVCEIGRQ